MPASRRRNAPRGHRALPAALCAAAVLAAPAAAEAERAWMATVGPATVSALYGTPESDDVVLAFDCDRATKALVISLRAEPAKARDGMRATIEIASDAATLKVPATGARSQLDDAFVLTARTDLSPRLRKALRRGTTLTLTADGARETIPLTGAEPAVAALLAACGKEGKSKPGKSKPGETTDGADDEGDGGE